MDRDYNDTLRWVNAQRAYRGFDVLPNLPRWVGCIDPIERAFAPLKVRVCCDSIWIDSYPGRVVIPLPPSAQRFLEKLDAGRYDSFLAPLSEACTRETHMAWCAHSVTSRLRAA